MLFFFVRLLVNSTKINEIKLFIHYEYYFVVNCVGHSGGIVVL